MHGSRASGHVGGSMHGSRASGHGACMGAGLVDM